MIDDLVFAKPLLLRQACPSIKDFNDYLHLTGGEVRPDCPFLTKLVVSEAEIHQNAVPPLMINIGKNSFTARAFDFDFLSDPNIATQTPSGGVDSFVAEHYLSTPE